jgi:hypothetical protein
MSLASSAADAYRNLLGARAVDTDCGWPLVLRPELSMWYDVNDKVGLHVSTGYMIARPHVTVTRPSPAPLEKTNDGCVPTWLA